MGFFDSLGKVFNPSSWMGSSGNSLLDLMDPGSTFHTGSSTRAANQQFAMEYDIAKKNYEESKAQNEWNRNFQEQQLQYQKDLNALQMEREDTATQRRVADLKAAGLSPTLAAGSAADTGALHAGSVTPVAPAQMGTPGDSKVQAAMFKEGLMKDRMQLAASLMGNIADISKTRAEVQLLNAQTNQLNAWTPIDLKLKSQLYEFNQEFNPYRIEEMIAKIENTRGDTFYKERQSFLVDSQKLLNEDQHGLNALIYAGQILDNELTRAKIDYQNQEYVKNAIAIELLRSQYKEYEYAKEFYHSRDVPVDFNPSASAVAFYGMHDIGSGLRDLGSGHLPQPLVPWFNTGKDFVGRVLDHANDFLGRIGVLGLLNRILGSSGYQYYPGNGHGASRSF